MRGRVGLNRTLVEGGRDPEVLLSLLPLQQAADYIRPALARGWQRRRADSSRPGADGNRRTGAALDDAIADEAWAPQARDWLKAVVVDEEHGFEDLQRVLQRMWVNVLGEDADAIANSGPDAEGLARLRQLRERIASLKAALTGQAGQVA